MCLDTCGHRTIRMALCTELLMRLSSLRSMAQDLKSPSLCLIQFSFRFDQASKYSIARSGCSESYRTWTNGSTFDEEAVGLKAIVARTMERTKE